MSAALQSAGNFTVQDCIRLLGGRQSAVSRTAYSQHITWSDCTITTARTSARVLAVKEINQTTWAHHGVLMFRLSVELDSRIYYHLIREVK